MAAELEPPLGDSTAPTFDYMNWAPRRNARRESIVRDGAPHDIRSTADGSAARLIDLDTARDGSSMDSHVDEEHEQMAPELNLSRCDGIARRRFRSS
jgi:hypothetical protein